MSIICSLYYSIQVPLYSDWLSDHDLTCLDTAVTNAEVRVLFLKILRSCSISNQGPVAEYGSKLLWISRRGLSIRSIIFKDRPETEDDLTTIERSVVTSLSSLESAEGSCCSLEKLLRICPVIRSLTVSVRDALHCVEMIALTKGLRSLTLQFETKCDVPSDFPDKIAQYCEELRSLRSDVLFDIRPLMSVATSLESISLPVSRSSWNLVIQSSAIHVTLLREVVEPKRIDAERDFVSRINLSKVQTFYLEMPLSKNMVGAMVRDCRSLTKLNLWSMDADDDVIAAIATNCPLLQTMRLRCRIRDNGLCALALNCKFLIAVSLRLCESITDFGVSFIVDNCRCLTSLDVSYTTISDVAIKNVFDRCSTLLKLYVVSTRVTIKGVLSLIRSLQYAGFGDDIVRFSPVLRQSMSIKSLMFDYESFISNSDLETFLQQSPGLCSCTIFAAWGKSVLPILNRFCPSLTSLAVYGPVIAEEMNMIVRDFRNLQLLEIAQSSISNDTLTALAKSCRKLTKLYLYDCRYFSVKGVLAIAEYCTELRRVCITNHYRITSKCISALLTRCQQLHVLDVHGCGLVDGTVLDTIVDLGRLMTLVDVCNCKMITSEDVRRFKVSMPEDMIVCFWYGDRT